jgi:deoxyribonuclease-4
LSAIRIGPARVLSRESPEQAVRLLQERKYTACEIDCEGGFWMDYPFAERFGELARDARIALSVHAPIAAFLGHREREKKYRMAIGMLDHSAGIAVAAGAELVVFHPGFLLERPREQALAAVVEQLGELRERLVGKGRDVAFGVEIMGRVRDFGTAEDVLGIAAQLAWVRPVLDFAHLHATSDGGFTETETFASVLEAADRIQERGTPFHIHNSDSFSPQERLVPFHIHFSDIAFANRNETKHLPYGEGTLRAQPLREALVSFERPATVISESPDEASSQIIRAVLLGEREDVPVAVKSAS